MDFPAQPIGRGARRCLITVALCAAALAGVATPAGAIPLLAGTGGNEAIRDATPDRVLMTDSTLRTYVIRDVTTGEETALPLPGENHYSFTGQLIDGGAIYVTSDPDTNAHEFDEY